MITPTIRRSLRLPSGWRPSTSRLGRLCLRCVSGSASARLRPARLLRGRKISDAGQVMASPKHAGSKEMPVARRGNTSLARGDVTLVPIAAVLDTRLILSDLRVLCVLGLETQADGWTRRSQVEIARRLNLARSTVQRSLERLEALGWVSIRLGRDLSPGHKPKWYRLNPSQMRPVGRPIGAGDGIGQA